MRRVFLETPFAAGLHDAATNLRYARACLRDCILRGEAPFASHLLYTQEGVLRDEVPSERATGIAAGFAFRKLCCATVVYTDCGISEGMWAGINHSIEQDVVVEYRSLDGWLP